MIGGLGISSAPQPPGHLLSEQAIAAASVRGSPKFLPLASTSLSTTSGAFPHEGFLCANVLDLDRLSRSSVGAIRQIQSYHARATWGW